MAIASDLDPHAQHRFGIQRENDRDHQPKDCQHDGERHSQHDEKQHLCTRRNNAARDLTDRLSAIAEAYHQRAEVVHGANERSVLFQQYW